VGFEPTIPASEQAKTVHALDRAATVTGNISIFIYMTNTIIDEEIMPQIEKSTYVPVKVNVSKIKYNHFMGIVPSHIRKGGVRSSFNISFPVNIFDHCSV
jgi:hypothetical protein